MVSVNIDLLKDCHLGFRGRIKSGRSLNEVVVGVIVWKKDSDEVDWKGEGEREISKDVD